MSNSRIAFYNPIPHQLVKGTGEIFRPPMALIGLAHVARRQGAEVVIVNGLHYEDADVQAQLKAFAPTHLCVSTYHQPNYVKRELAAMAPFRGKIPIIVGGHEASAWPEGVRSSLRPDFLFMGEGEVALEEFIRSGFRPDAMSAELATAENANGIWQIQGKKRFNLDELPLPTEITGFFRTPNKEMDWEQANINIARGCVGHCIYCGGAKKGLGHMSAHRVVEQMHAWKNLGFSYFDFLAADASSHPKKATQIAQAITQDGSFRGDGIYFFARGDTFVHALDLKLDDGTPGIEIWRAFLKMHAVEIETGLETTVLKRLLPAHFRKYPTQEAAAQHVDHFARICELARETGSKIATDLLSFDPDSTLRGIKTDYETLLAFAEQYPFINVHPSALYRELYPYPGTPAAQQFGIPGKVGRLRPYKDRRVPVVLHTLRIHSDFFVGHHRQPLPIILRRILKLIDFIQTRYPKPAVGPTYSQMDDYVEHEMSPHFN